MFGGTVKSPPEVMVNRGDEVDEIAAGSVVVFGTKTVVVRTVEVGKVADANKLGLSTAVDCPRVEVAGLSVVAGAKVRVVPARMLTPSEGPDVFVTVRVVVGESGMASLTRLMLPLPGLATPFETPSQMLPWNNRVMGSEDGDKSTKIQIVANVRIIKVPSDDVVFLPSTIRCWRPAGGAGAFCTRIKERLTRGMSTPKSNCPFLFTSV